MAIQYKTLVNAKYLEATQTTQITSEAITILDKVTVTNVSGNNISFSANICDSSETVSNSNLVVKDRTLAPNETYECFELVGQTLELDSFLSMLASAASSLVLKIDGRIIT
jgi:hypothetical protein